MKTKRTRTISRLLLAIVATAAAAASPAPVQAQYPDGIVACKPVDKDSTTSLSCLLCHTSCLYRLFNPWKCAGCTKPYAPMK